MLTREQYNFLKEFDEIAKKNKKDYGSEEVDVERLYIMLEDHPELNPSNPLNNNNDADEVGKWLMSSVIDTYLDEIKIVDCFAYNKYSDKFGLSPEGIKQMNDYKRNNREKFWFPLCSLIISGLSFFIAIASLVVACIK